MSRLGIVVALLMALAVFAFLSMANFGGPGGRSPSLAVDRSIFASAPPQPVAGRPGGLRIPVQGIASSALAESWADPRGDGTRSHHAIDIPATNGTPVLAAADGRIEKLFDSKLGGHTVYQRSADGQWIYYYAHLDRYAPTLVEGQAVRAGDPIAAVGSTGDANPAAPHLHFEIHRMAPGERWWQGREIDPYPILRGR